MLGALRSTQPVILSLLWCDSRALLPPLHPLVLSVFMKANVIYFGQTAASDKDHIGGDSKEAKAGLVKEPGGFSGTSQATQVAAESVSLTRSLFEHLHRAAVISRCKERSQRKEKEERRL